MEYGIVFIKYEVLDNETIVASGECPTFFLNSLTDAYCDFENSPYKLKIYYKNREYIVSSPLDFHVP